MRIILKPWVAIMTAAITAISYGLNVFDVWEKAPLGVIALISFIIFAIIVIGIIYDKERTIKKLTDEDAKRRREKEDLELQKLRNERDRGYPFND